MQTAVISHVTAVTRNHENEIDGLISGILIVNVYEIREKTFCGLC
jgi:hypothetical protein